MSYPMKDILLLSQWTVHLPSDRGSIPHSGIQFFVHLNLSLTLQTVQLHRKAEKSIMNHNAWTVTPFFFNRTVAIVITNILYLRNIVTALPSPLAGHW